MTGGKVRCSPKAAKKSFVEKKKQTVAGKKRKKKDAVFEKEEVEAVQASGMVTQNDVAVSLPVHKPFIPAHHFTLHGDKCSSSSSLENSKPQRKLGRYENVSSDTMNMDQTSASSAVESCHGSSHSLSTLSPSSSDQTCQPLTSQDRILEVVSCNSTPNDSNNMEILCTPPRDSPRQLPNHLPSCPESTTDSLRWTNVCLDEEKEKERIRVYKENRRKRYEDALKKVELDNLN